MNEESSFAGTLLTTALYSPLNFALGTGTEAVRQIWSELSERYVGGAPRAPDLEDEWLRPGLRTEAPCEARMTERRDRPVERLCRPRAFLAIRISSKSLMFGLDACCLSRSWTNSLNAMIDDVSTYSYQKTERKIFFGSIDVES